MKDDSDTDDEDFEWFNDEEHKDQTYFALVNCDRRTVKKGEQIYYCYGKRSNLFLLLKYVLSTIILISIATGSAIQTTYTIHSHSR